MTKNDSGAAFPTNPIYNGDDRATEYDGMSLRDWFAGQALKGMLASGDADCEDYAAAADYAFTYADAMIAERSK